jgi:hypothetical protein
LGRREEKGHDRHDDKQCADDGLDDARPDDVIT